MFNTINILFVHLFKQKIYPYNINIIRIMYSSFKLVQSNAHIFLLFFLKCKINTYFMHLNNNKNIRKRTLRKTYKNVITFYTLN